MRGGSRPGAGRKPGTSNKVSAERRAEIEASGLTPLDYMLGILRNENMPDARRDWAAEKAAPFVHAKLSSVDMKAEHDIHGFAVAGEPVEDAEAWAERYGPQS